MDVSQVHHVLLLADSRDLPIFGNCARREYERVVLELRSVLEQDVLLSVLRGDRSGVISIRKENRSSQK